MQIAVLARKYVVGDRGQHQPRNVSACFSDQLRKVTGAVRILGDWDLLWSWTVLCCVWEDGSAAQIMEGIAWLDEDGDSSLLGR